MAATQPEMRLTQRAPQSCYRCSSRKIKCSKTVPCETCVNLGLGHRCEREVVIITRQDRRTPQTPRRPGRRGRPPGALNKKTLQGVVEAEQGLERPQSNTQGGRDIISGQDLEQPLQPNEYAFSLSEQHNYASNRLGTFEEHGLTMNIVPHNVQQRESPDQSSTLSQSNHGQSPNEIVDGLPEPHILTSWRNDEALAENAAMTLEFLAWGRQRDAGVSPESIMSIQQSNTVLDILSIQQAKGVIDFHRGSLTWMHSVIHWPTFYTECENFWRHGVVEEKAWTALYYAVLSLGVHHMNTEQHTALGIPTGFTTSRQTFPAQTSETKETTARQLYNLSYTTLKDADFLAVHSVNSLKVIIMLSLIAHSFDGSNLIAVLLSCATRIAQTLNIHNMGPDPTEQLPLRDVIDREIRKRIWIFLCIQDWLLIPFDNSYSISIQHCDTPMPLNSDEYSGMTSGFSASDGVSSTHVGYILVMYQVASVYRNFYDKTSCRSSAQKNDGGSLRELYDHILTSDEELKAVLKTVPRYLQRGVTHGSDYPLYVTWQQRTFAISVAHKTLMIHQRFFLKSLKDKWYTYTRITCIQAARTILEEYYTSFKNESNDMWTIPAHVVSASIILLLDHLLSEEESASNRLLVCDCLNLLERSEKQSTLLAKGIRLIRILLQYTQHGSPPNLGQIALRLRESGGGGTGLSVGQVFTNGGGSGGELWNWDEFLDSIDMNFDGSYV